MGLFFIIVAEGTLMLLTASWLFCRLCHANGFRLFLLFVLLARIPLIRNLFETPVQPSSPFV
jgi:hypothetical protein